VLFAVWSLAMFVAMGNIGRVGAVLNVFHWIAWGGFPIAFLAFVVAGVYYGYHVRSNRRLTPISRFFWLLSPAFCFVPYLFYWSKYVKDE